MRTKEVITRVCAYCKAYITYNPEQPGYYIRKDMKVFCDDNCMLNFVAQEEYQECMVAGHNPPCKRIDGEWVRQPATEEESR